MAPRAIKTLPSYLHARCQLPHTYMPQDGNRIATKTLYLFDCNPLTVWSYTKQWRTGAQVNCMGKENLPLYAMANKRPRRPQLVYNLPHQYICTAMCCVWTRMSLGWILCIVNTWPYLMMTMAMHDTRYVKITGRWIRRIISTTAKYDQY